MYEMQMHRYNKTEEKSNMNSRIYKLAFILILGGLFAAACGGITPPGGGEGEPTPVPTVIPDVEIVSEGRETDSFDLAADSPDYDQLVDKVFAADQTICWW